MSNDKQTLTDRLSSHEIELLRFIEQFNFKINSAGYFDLDETWRCDGRVIHDSMFFIFFEGSAFLKIKEEEHFCQRGTISFMPESYPQKWWLDHKKKHETIRLAVIHLDPINAWNLNLFKLFETLFVKIKNIDYWQNRLMYFVALYNTDKALGEESGKSFLKELLTALILEGFKIKEPDTNVDQRIIKVLAFIHEKYTEDIDVEQLSELSRLSSAQLRKVFFQELKINPKEYIYHYRLKQATEMLKHTNLTIKEIAFKTGFKNDHYFHIVFKKNFNLTPSEFRNKGLKEFGV